MKKEDVKKEVIEFGDFLLWKDCLGYWDFYCKYGADGNLKRCTYENFAEVEVIGNIVYVQKKEEKSDENKKECYNLKGEKICVK